MVKRHSIALVIVYFGKWPAWFPAFLLSCESNADVDWLVFTDCPSPTNGPPNVKFFPSSMEEIRALACDRLGCNVSLTSSRKLCEIRPCYGVLFEEYLAGYDFWGYCDLDVVWGRIRHFLNGDILGGHDVVTTRKGRLAGHMSILRNTPQVNLLFRNHKDFESIMARVEYCWFDEQGFSDVIAGEESSGSIRVYWPGFLVNFGKHVDSLPSYLSWLDRFVWRNGAVYCLAEKKREVLYVHFMNWKSTMNWCGFAVGSGIDCFWIGFQGVVAEGERLPIGYRLRARLKTIRKPSLYLLYFIRMFKRAIY